MRLSDENLKGRTVISADGQAVGEIAALFVDSGTWRVESLQINLRKEIADCSARAEAYSTRPHLNCLYDWFSQSATLSFCQYQHWSCGTFCRD